MNMNTIINMVIRQVVRRAVNFGIGAGINAASKVGKGRQADGEDAVPPLDTSRAAKQARLAQRGPWK